MTKGRIYYDYNDNDSFTCRGQQSAAFVTSDVCRSKDDCQPLLKAGLQVLLRKNLRHADGIKEGNKQREGERDVGRDRETERAAA